MQIMIRDIPIHYETQGQGMPIIILPGWSMSAYTVAHMVEPGFAGRSGWRRIYIDPPGHGPTPGADWIQNLDHMLDLLVEAVDQLIGQERFALYGLSLGAYLTRGILYHRRQNVAGLFMVVPVIVCEDDRRDVPAQTVLVEEPGIMDTLAEDEKEMFAICTVRTTNFLNELRAYPQPPAGEMGDLEFLDKIRQDPRRYRFSFPVDQLDRPFPAPTTIISGRQDSVVGYNDAWKILPNYPRATFIVSDRAGHFMEEKNEFINFHMHDWLDRVEEYVKL